VQQELLADTTKSTGINITCSCCDIQSTELIHCYHQLLGLGPAFVMSCHKGSKELRDPPGQLSVVADPWSSALWLAGPWRGDTVLYDCTL
ncbi:hypothetical protein N323_07110, partial [Cathartes aura]